MNILLYRMLREKGTKEFLSDLEGALDAYFIDLDETEKHGEAVNTIYGLARCLNATTKHGE